MSTEKQPPKVFYKKSCSEKFRKIHRKTPLLESLFNKVAAQNACNFIKKRLQHRRFPVNIAKRLRAAIFSTLKMKNLSNSHMDTWSSGSEGTLQKIVLKILNFHGFIDGEVKLKVERLIIN